MRHISRSMGVKGLRLTFIIQLIAVLILTVAANAHADVIIDNGKAGTSYTGKWTSSSGASPYGSNSLYARPTATYTWSFSSQPAGFYEVFMWWTSTNTRPTQAPVTITTAEGTETVYINQAINGGKWVSLGIYPFDTQGSVKITAVNELLSNGTIAATCADAVWFKLVDENIPPVAQIDSISPNPASAGNEISFTGHATDADGSIVSYLWESDISGVIGTTASFDSAPLPEGLHTITFTATDNEGTASKPVTWTLNVGNLPLDIVIDNGAKGTAYTGTWTASTGAGFYGTNSLYARPTATYTWSFDSKPSGYYEVFVWWTSTNTRASNVPVTITDSTGVQTVSINQTKNGGKWNSLGMFYFDSMGSVTVTASNEKLLNGTIASTCADAVWFRLVTENESPVATIDAIAPNPASTTDIVSFSGHGTDSDGTVAGYKWTSSIDGTLGNVASFDSAPLSAGTHTITFTVTDDKGAQSAPATRTLTVNAPAPANKPPVASINTISPNPAVAGTSVIFSGSGNDTDGTVVGYKWVSSIDGTIGSSSSFSTSTLSTGTHTITFTVTDDDGAQSSAVTQSLTIQAAPSNQAPVATIASISPNPADAGAPVAFSGSGNDTDGTIASYRWVSDIDGTIGSAASFSTTALTAGTHTITFTVTDDDGAQSSPATRTLTINALPSNQSPVAAIDSITPNPAELGNEVAFTGHGSDTDGTVSSYKWESSIDGIIGTTASFSTSALSAGTHTITLTVTDDDGAASQAATGSLTIGSTVPEDLIIDNGKPGTSYTGTWPKSSGPNPYGADSLYARPSATYTWRFSSRPAGYYEVFMWWTATDTRPTGAKVDVNSAGGASTVYVNQALNGGKWNSLGTYKFVSSGSVVITASSEKLANGSTTATCADAVMFRFVSGVSEPPTADFSADKTNGGAPCTISFTDKSMGEPTQWLWDFGDGSTSGERNPSHVYSSIGSYTVSLTVSNAYGSNAVRKQAYIQVVAALENIFICDGYDGGGPVIPDCRTELQALGAVNTNGVWRYENTTKGVTYLIHEVNDPEGMRQALTTEGAHVIFKGHSNYGLGATFTKTDADQARVRYFDDDLIVQTCTDMVDPDITGLIYSQAYPNWQPIRKDGTSPIMPYDFNDPNGTPPYNYYVTYTIPGDPTHYRMEKPDGSYWERFPDSKKPAWYSPSGSKPDPTENPEYFITNSSADFNSCSFVGTWPVDSPGDWHTSTTYIGQNYQYHNKGTGTNKAIWTLVVEWPGVYAVIASWHAASTHATNAPYTIRHANGETVVRVNQRSTNYMNVLGAYYFNKGTYTVELSDDADGRVAADIVALSYVGNPASFLNAEFYANVRTGGSPLTVQFTDNSSVYDGSFTPTHTVRWDFGDGTTSTLTSPSHTYSEPGLYTVTLTIRDAAGNTDTETKEQFIAVGLQQPLKAQFTSSTQTSVINSGVNFIDQSTGAILSRLWDFGDGTTSTKQNPIHTYTTPGTYTVSLTVTSQEGTSTSTEQNYMCITVGLAAADNLFNVKPHYYTVYSGALMGRAIMDASPTSLSESELKYSRLFYSSCTSGAYYLGKLHRGPTFYTTERTEGRNPIPGYLRRYLEGWTDEQLVPWVKGVNPIYEYYNFDQKPPSMR